MAAQEFDAHATTYSAQHAASIRLSGEEPAYFADYKIRELARLAALWGLERPAILDFGSGIGNSLPPFRRYFPKAAVTGSDVSAESLAEARRLHGGSEPQLLIEGDRLPCPDAAFDLVFTACVFHHIDHADHAAWLAELHRVTRPGGRIVIFEHNPWNPLTLHAVRNCPFDENAHLIAAPEMKRRLAAAGWGDVRADFHVFFPARLAALRGLEPGLRWCPMGAQYAAHARRAPGRP